jgi:hypothetical protein
MAIVEGISNWGWTALAAGMNFVLATKQAALLLQE